MSDPLDGAVEVDWQRPLDEFETAVKDEQETLWFDQSPDIDTCDEGVCFV
jgi:hypothetical protein